MHSITVSPLPGIPARYPVLLALLALLAALALPAPAHAQAPGRIFRGPSDLLGPPGPDGMAVADLDLDGRPDIVVGGSATPGCWVAFGRGGELFTPFQPFLASLARTSVGGVGDVDGDGRPDVVGVTFHGGGPEHEVFVAYGDGHRAWPDSFVVAADYDFSFPPVDLNGDGRADLVVAHVDSDSIAVYLGNANRTLTFAGAYRTPGDVTHVAAGHVTGSGLDLVVGSDNVDTLAIFPGNGDGTFGARIDVPLGSDAAEFVLGAFDGAPGDDIVGGLALPFFASAAGGSFGPASALPQQTFIDGYAAADLDHDGKLDIVGSAYPSGILHVAYTWLGDGAGGFSPRIDSRFCGYVTALPSLADVNGDGELDLALEGIATANRLLVAPGRGDGSFGGPSPPPELAVTFGGVAVGDFDGDGHADAVASGDDNKLAFARGHGDGTFDPFVASAPMGLQFAQLYAGRFDADANLDLVGIVNSPPTLSYLKGRGDGTFDAPVNFALGATPALPALIDLDGDGRTDIVVPCTGTSALYIAMGGASGPLAPVTSATPAGPVAARYRDLNGDGKLDRVLVCSGQMVMQMGDGVGGFTTSQQVPFTPTPADVELADLDGDGLPEAILPEGPTGFTTLHPTVHVLKGQAGGAFGADSPVSLDWVEDPSATRRSGVGKLDVLDLDGDGKLDFVALDVNRPAALLAARGRGDGTFDRPEAYAGPFSPSARSLGDIDGDGLIDVVQAGTRRGPTNGIVSSLNVFLNRTNGVAAAPPGGSPAHAGTALAITSLAPNPSRGRFTVQLTAARAGTASLALYTPSGRAVYTRDGIALRAGANAIALDPGAALPAGVYWLRASTAAGASAVRKLVLLGQ